MKVKLKKGISLIVLVITIIVMIVLAGAVILALSNSGIIEKATSSAFKTDVKTIKEEYEYKMAELKLNDETFDQTTLNASDTTLSYNTKTEEGGNLYSIVPTAEKYKDEFEVRDGVLRYKGENYKKLNWAEEVGITTNRYEIVDGVLLSSNANLLLVGTDGKIRIPSNVVKIGEGAFSNVDGLKEVIIPGNVKEIGQNAFSSNKTLEKVVMEEGVTTIGLGAFYNCTLLKSVSMTDSVVTLNEQSFNGCISLSDIKLSNNITEIPYNFSGCSSLNQFKLPTSVKKISNILWNTGVEEIYLPSSLETIDGACFKGTNLSKITVDKGNINFVVEDGILYGSGKTSIIYLTADKKKEESITIAEGVTKLDGIIFAESSIQNISLPSTLTTIENYFSSDNIKSITVAEGNKYFASKDGSLYNKDMTKTVAIISDEQKVTIPEGVTAIGSYSLYLCKNATEVVFPESLKSLRAYSITHGNKSTAVEKVSIGASVNDIAHLALYNGYKLKEVNINSGNKTYSADDNFLYKLNSSGVKQEVVEAIVNESNVTIPEGIKKIEKYAFYNNKIANITLPSTLTEISDSAFSSCYYLNNVQIPSGVDTIGRNVFLNCTSLKSVNINRKKGSISGSPWGIPIGERAITWTEN